MSNDGKLLEGLVAYVEETLGATVEVNRREYTEEGAQLAEFDVIARGKVGSTEFAWLIECRDRPKAGPAPGNWIQELKGRRDLNNFDKVTAVSTTGFSPSAIEYAKRGNIELRSFSKEALDWLRTTQVSVFDNRFAIRSTFFRIDENTDPAIFAAAEKFRGQIDPTHPLLLSVRSGERHSLNGHLQFAVQELGIHEQVIGRTEPFTLPLQVDYTNDEDYYVLETEAGNARIRSIRAIIDCVPQHKTAPLAGAYGYRTVGSEALISQFARFAPFELNDAFVSFEIHNIPDSGFMHLVLRSQKKEDDDS